MSRGLGARRRDARGLPGQLGGAETRRANIRVTAVGRPRSNTGAMGTPGAVVLDGGSNRGDGKLGGDVAAASVGPVASAITPLPGGVGAMLLNTTLQAFERSAALSS